MKHDFEFKVHNGSWRKHRFLKSLIKERDYLTSARAVCLPDKVSQQIASMEKSLCSNAENSVRDVIKMKLSEYQ